MAETLTRQYVDAEIRARIGGSSVKVEYQPSDLDMELRAAVRHINTYTPRMMKKPLANCANGRHLLEEPNIIGVISVSSVDTTAVGLTGPNLSNVLVPNTLDLGMASTFDTVNAYIDDVSLIYGTRISYHTQQEVVEGASRTVLYVQNAGASQTIGVTYAWGIDPEWYPDASNASNPNYGKYGIRHLRMDETGWLVEFLTARMKQIVARPRMKFGGVPTPQGGVDTTDGETLMNEGKTDEKELVATLKSRKLRLGLSIV